MFGVPPVDVKAALLEWRRAEVAYTVATERFVNAVDEWHLMEKDDLIELVRLRRQADSCRESFFLASQQARNTARPQGSPDTAAEGSGG